MPIEDATAGIVLAFDSYDHWQDQPQCLKEVRRVLRPKSLFVVVKDGGLPKETSKKGEFLEALENAEFRVEKEIEIVEGAVTFTQWVCVLQ